MTHSLPIARLLARREEITTINDRLESLENSYNDFAVILRSVVETQREHTTILKTVAELLDNVVSNQNEHSVELTVIKNFLG